MEDYKDEVHVNRTPSSNVIRVEDAFIEEIRISGNTGYVTISHGVLGDFGVINIELVTLVVNRNTNIRGRRGESLNLRDLREGMVVDATFSATMTFSQPPQTRAYRITVVRDSRPGPGQRPGLGQRPGPGQRPGQGSRPRPDTETTVATVVQIDTRNDFLYTISSTNAVDLRRFVISDDTVILNRNGNRITLRNIRVGQRVRIEHANWQTRSIPPQTVAYMVRVL